MPGPELGFILILFGLLWYARHRERQVQQRVEFERRWALREAAWRAGDRRPR